MIFCKDYLIKKSTFILKFLDKLKIFKKSGIVPIFVGSVSNLSVWKWELYLESQMDSIISQ